MSYTAVILPILSVLSIAEQTFLDTEGKWLATNDQQTILMKDYYSRRHELKKLLPDELKSIASRDISKVNRFLKKNGFEIQLNQQSGDTFAVASILKIMLEWPKEGTKSKIYAQDKEYPAVHMQSGYTIKRTDFGEDIITIRAKNGDFVKMSPTHTPLHGFELLREIASIQSHLSGMPSDTYEDTDSIAHKTRPGISFTHNYKDVTNSYDGLLFPMVDIKQKVDISWLIGMTHSGGKITQAAQETQFKMNEKGATAKSVAGIGGITCVPEFKPIFTIDKPFYLWIERPGMTIPLFAAYVDPSDWKAPENLD